MASNFFSDETVNDTRAVLSVGELNSYVEGLLSSDSFLRSVSCEGEISGFKRYYSSGHCYFTLKDESASISCVMFKGYADSLRFAPRDGMRVILSGYVSLYAKEGRYQFFAQSMRSVGEGELYARFLELKKKLEDEGLFAEEHKKPLPLLPDAVGVVTSASGAVFHDIMNVTRRRFPEMSIVLSPCSVQGSDAPQEICRAIRLLDRSGMCDVIIVGRGGGKLEDLWCFNDESVARAIYDCKTPVISAVGHETDFTIADFAADVRAPTPSAAAELAVPVYDDLMLRINELERKADDLVMQRIESAERYLEKARLTLMHTEDVFNMREMKLSALEMQIDETVRQKMDATEKKLAAMMDTLDALSPYSVLLRGFAMVKAKDGSIITSAAQLRETGQGLLTFADGNVEVRISDEKGKKA